MPTMERLGAPTGVGLPDLPLRSTSTLLKEKGNRERGIYEGISREKGSIAKVLLTAPGVHLPRLNFWVGAS
eukprot:500035-Amorphochlora_amoeboformis.AAC.1